MGVSATNWAPNQRTKNVKMNKGNMRNMKYKGLTSFEFARRIEAYGDRRPLSKDAIVQWIEKGREARQHHDGSATKTTNKSLLEKIVDVIESEKPDLLFDYFAIHRQPVL
jgi:hypothetical protein